MVMNDICEALPVMGLLFAGRGSGHRAAISVICA
jgi:hypothetical protein